MEENQTKAPPTPAKIEARIRRGKKWERQKDVEGELIKNVADDPNKMVDVEFYLNSIKPKEKETKSKGKK